MNSMPSNVLRMIIAGVAFWGALATSGLCSPAPSASRIAAGCSVLVVVSVLTCLVTTDLRRCLRLAVTCLAACTTMALAPGGAPLAYALGLIFVLPRSLAMVGDALLAFTLLVLLAGGIPEVSDAGAWIATRLGRALQQDDSLELGPSAAGLPAFLGALFVLAYSTRRRRPWSLVFALTVCGLALVTQWSFAGAVNGTLTTFASHGHPPKEFFSQQLLGVGLAVGVSLAMASESQGSPSRITAEPRHTRRLWHGAAIGLLLGMTLLSVVGPTVAPDRSVAFLNVGGLDWKRPKLEDPENTGMFGMLPLYLEASGWEVNAVDLEELTEGEPLDSKVLVLINCHHVWSPTERQAVETFVQDGGSLLVLGDHTDVFGLMRGLNSLIIPWGIAFNFDSACDVKGGWDSSATWSPWPLGIRLAPEDAGYGTGATLAIRSPARPVLTAHYGFSDLGVRENVMGAYLGDYKYVPGEELGDSILIAHRRLGEGAVLVYGDTSGFQNLGLASTYTEHVQPVFESLARGGGSPHGTNLVSLLAAIVLAGSAFSCSTTLRSWVIGGLRGLAMGAVASLLVLEHRTIETASPYMSSRTLVLDQSTFPDTGHYLAGWNTVSPLLLAGCASGLLVAEPYEWSPQLARPDNVYALVGPRRPLTASQTDTLLSMMEQGGTVIVAASGNQAAAVAPLLEPLGVTIASTSLGNVPPRQGQKEGEPRFVNASPVLIAPAAGAYDTLYRYGDVVVAIARDVGAGHLVVLGDKRFFSTDNITGRWGYWPGNLNFLAGLLNQYCGGDLDAPTERFHEPLSPTQ